MAANVIMASSTKTHIPSTSTSPSKPKFQNLSQISLNLPNNKEKMTKMAKFASASLAAVLAVAPEAMAVEIEKAQLFDFDFTLPIIATEFLLLMFALDKVYYSPLGNFMDKRDADIKEKLSSVKDTSAEVKQLEDQAAAVMRAARAEISAALNKMKKETTLEVEQKIAEGRKNIEVELQEALAGLAKQKEDTIKALESQIAALSQDIVKKVLPS